jgi:hypothetical protein
MQKEGWLWKICGECYDEDEGDICFMLAEQQA